MDWDLWPAAIRYGRLRAEMGEVAAGMSVMLLAIGERLMPSVAEASRAISGMLDAYWRGLPWHRRLALRVEMKLRSLTT